MKRHGWLVLVLLLAVVGAGGCRGLEPTEASGPETPMSCASWAARHSDSPFASRQPTATMLTYRGEEMADGSVRMTVGDIDAAPQHPDAVRVFDYLSPESKAECGTRFKKVSGWWCTTTVEPIEVEGEIVLGDAEPRARIGGEGFTTRCQGRPDRMRQVFQVERDSWSGWRDYGEPRQTAWTRSQEQAGEPVFEPCPAGRVGTYDYQLIASVEVEGVQVSTPPAVSAPIRNDCGTGVS